jgi:hypothetical protein
MNIKEKLLELDYNLFSDPNLRIIEYMGDDTYEMFSLDELTNSNYSVLGYYNDHIFGLVAEHLKALKIKHYVFKYKNLPRPFIFYCFLTNTDEILLSLMK